MKGRIFMSTSSIRMWLRLFLLPAALLILAACGDSDRDELAPLITLTTAIDTVSWQREASIALAGTIEEGATLEARLNDDLVDGLTVNADWSWGGVIDGLREGNNVIAITAVDAAGNTNTIQITVVRDNVAPKVTATAPADNAVNVAVDTKLNVTFSEALQKESIAPNFTLASPEGSVECTVDYTEGALVAVITPDSSLTAGTTYTATLGAGITDLAGNPLEPSSFVFTTAVP
jgi:methionine-rich copper-binding protein CopC